MGDQPAAALTDDEVAIIYAAFDTVNATESRTPAGRREIVEPLYEAFLTVRDARILAMLRADQPAAPETERLREAGHEELPVGKTNQDWAFRSHCKADGEPWPCRAVLLATLAQPATPETERLREAAVALCMLWFTDNAPDGSPHLRKAMLDLRAAIEAGDDR